MSEDNTNQRATAPRVPSVPARRVASPSLTGRAVTDNSEDGPRNGGAGPALPGVVGSIPLEERGRKSDKDVSFARRRKAGWAANGSYALPGREERIAARAAGRAEGVALPGAAATPARPSLAARPVEGEEARIAPSGSTPVSYGAPSLALAVEEAVTSDAPSLSLELDTVEHPASESSASSPSGSTSPRLGVPSSGGERRAGAALPGIAVSGRGDSSHRGEEESPSLGVPVSPVVPARRVAAPVARSKGGVILPGAGIGGGDSAPSLSEDVAPVAPVSSVAGGRRVAAVVPVAGGRRVGIPSGGMGTVTPVPSFSPPQEIVTPVGVEYGESGPFEEEEELVVSPRLGRPARGESAPGARAVGFTATPVSDVDDNWEEAGEEEEEERREAARKSLASKGFRIMERDLDILRLLARYRYAMPSQVARYVNTSDKAASIRLMKMARADLIRKEEVTRGQTLWTPLSAGLAIADIDLPPITSGKISITTMAHELGLLNLGIELEIGGDNVLGEEGWPHYNRYLDDWSAEPVLGERVITTREIRQGMARWNRDKDRMQMIRERDEALSAWEPGEISPELLPGNAGMFVMYSQDYKDHVPDMVVGRNRDEETGAPRSIAIELELNPKPLKDWRRILMNYKSSNMFDKLYYYTHKKSIADMLIKLNKEEIGIDPENFKVRRYTPRKGGLPFWG